MKIEQNEKLGLTEDQAKAWPFWSYGYCGTDGVDWRQHYTSGGFFSLPSYTEEACPLTMEQAAALSLVCEAVTIGYPAEGGILYRIVSHDGGTVRQMMAYLTEKYVNSHGLSIQFEGAAAEYTSTDQVPAPYQDLVPVATEMLLHDGAMRLRFRLYEPDQDA